MHKSTIDELILQNVESTYKQNRYGKVFFDLVAEYRPQRIVELGVYMGYSGLHLALALKNLPSLSQARELHLIDLWDRYPYRHCSLETTRRNFEQNGFLACDAFKVLFKTGDVLESAQDFEDDSIDLLHVDISNDGQKLRECFQAWNRKVRRRGIFAFEGGSPDRDRVDWMTEFHKEPISNFLKSAQFGADYEYKVLEPYPSLTISVKK